MEQENWMPESHEILSSAIRESELLLAYASSHSIQLDETIVRTLIQARQLLDEQTMNAERAAQEGAFWAARATLAHAVRPISAESLKQCTAPISTTGWWPAWLNQLLRRKPHTATAVEIFISTVQFRLFFPIAMLLLVQMYSLAGSELVGDLIPRFEKMQSMQMDALKAAAEVGKEDEQNLKTVTKQIEVTQLEIEIRIEMLRVWSAGWTWIAIPFQTNEPALEKKSPNIDSKNSTSTQYQHDRAVVLKAQFVLEVLQNFILPMLYGCLGAALFVLRSLAQDAKEQTFDVERKIGYNLRFYMGSLCGLVIGWFIPDAPVQEAGMTQYSLSVLGGYSVDIVFVMMDKIIATFSGSTTTKSEK